VLRALIELPKGEVAINNNKSKASYL